VLIEHAVHLYHALNGCRCLSLIVSPYLTAYVLGLTPDGFLHGRDKQMLRGSSQDGARSMRTGKQMPASIDLVPLHLPTRMIASHSLVRREGVEASRRGVELNIFRLGDYQIPYGYTPLLVATADTVRC